MRKFSVGIDDFYEKFPFTTPRIDACMKEVIARYAITGKSVLSVGAGAAFEEKHFALAGNELLLIDIDESGSILPQLDKMPAKPGLSYWIGDAAEFEKGLGTYDVLYYSGFTPDELRRGSIVQANAEEGRTWSVDDDPFHPVVMGYTSAIKDGGLLLIQSYCGGIDTDYNASYLAACQRQLASHDLHLVEIHRFKETHGVMLYAATKGRRQLPPGEPIAQFHGRAASEPVERIFAASSAGEGAAGAAGLAHKAPLAQRLRRGAPLRVRRLLNRLYGRFVRYPSQRIRGFASANPNWKDYTAISTTTLARAIAEITASLPERRWKTVIDHGCGSGRKALALRSIADHVWGIDILPADGVSHVDRYIRVAIGDPNCCSPIKDDEIDVVFIYNYTGFRAATTWRTYFSPANDRISVYLEPQNFPRIIRKGGYLMISEWEAEPEARWGKAPIAEIVARAPAEYDPPPLPGFELVASGFSKAGRAPYVVYRRV